MTAEVTEGATSTGGRQPTFGMFPNPQTAPYDGIADRARRAEAMGFDSLWLADETPMAYPGQIHFEAWSLLGALARETSRVSLGTLVTPVAFRHPLLLAMSVSTVDHISNGRVILGLGVGGVKEDLAGLGQETLTARELVDRLEEQVVILDALLRGETLTRETGSYQTRDAVIERPVQRPRPPILVAAQAPRALRVAARHADIWNSLGGQPIEGDRLALDDAVAVTRRHVELLDDACLESGRDPSTLRRSVFAFRHDVYASPDAFAEWVGRYRDLGFDDFFVTWPTLRGQPSADREAVLEQVAADLLPRLRVS